MSYILLLLLLGSSTLITGETSLKFDQLKEGLEKSGKQLSIKEFAEAPDAVSYLNHDLTKNSPHTINLADELTKHIREWSPRLLALDATCPYYFSKLTNSADPDEDLNLLSYLLAIETNKTLDYPFIDVLPQSMRNAISLPSIFQCNELINSTSNRFFHNIELIIGPGQTELSLEQQSNTYSHLYCSLYGWPHFVLVDQTKQPTKTSLSQDNLANSDFVLTNLAPGTCLYVPSDWTIGAQLNNSISLVYTLRKIEKAISNDESLPCTDIDETTLDTIQFDIIDKFNLTEIGLIVYFYQYLNPPMFDKQYNTETFFEHFRQDRNISQLIMKWTAPLTDLINNTLFRQLDINHDGQFSIDDYFQIKRSNLIELQNSIFEVLEKLRETVVVQYNELNDTITKFSQHFANLGAHGDSEEALQTLLENLPEQIKEKLGEKNDRIKQILSQAEDKKSKRPSGNKQRVREDDASILFDTTEDDGNISNTAEEQEEEITAEPNSNETDPHRTDL